jgi:RecA-family ATPase/5S rRNA maturation endonuclease (ribonuclease M5)
VITQKERTSHETQNRKDRRLLSRTPAVFGNKDLSIPMRDERTERPVPAQDLVSLARKLGGEVSGGQVKAPGPGHSPDDRSMSVMLAPDAEGGFIVNSFSPKDDFITCRDHIRSRLGLPPWKPNGRGTSGEAKPKPKPKAKLGEIVATYDYTDIDGNLLYQVVRYEPKGAPKEFRQRRPGAVSGTWIWDRGGIPETLYYLPDVRRGIKETPREEQNTWFLCEGEKDVEALLERAFYATTNSGGADNFKPEFAEHFRDAKDVILLEDADKAGAERAKTVPPLLFNVGARVRVLRIADYEPKGAKDIAEWFDKGGTRAKLIAILNELPDWEPPPTADKPSIDSDGVYDPGPPPDGEPEKSIEPFKTFDLADWKGVAIETQPELVKDRIPLGEPGIITGDGGIGKTILMFQLGLPVALDRMDWPDWIGGVIETYGPVMIFSAEEKLKRLHPRASRILASRGLSFDDVKRGRLELICDPENEPILATVDHRTGLVTPTLSLRRLERNIAALRPVLIIIENASDVFGGNGNDPIAVKRFVTRHLGGLCAISGATLALIQQPSVSGMRDETGRSGTVQWRNAGRWFLNFTTVKRTEDAPDDGERELIVHKHNYGKSGERVRLRWDDGVFRPIGAASAIERAAAQAPIDDAFLACLVAATEQGLDVHVTTGRGYAPSVFAAMPQAKGNTSKALEGAMQRLLNDGKIRNEPYGSTSKGTKRLARC